MKILRSSHVTVLTSSILLAVGVVVISPTAQAAETLDQSSTGSGSWYAQLSSTQWDAQTFTAGMTGPLSKVDLKLSKSGSPTSIVVSIKSVDGFGLPTGPDLASEVVSEAMISSGPGGTVSVRFSTPIAVTNGSQYAIYLSNCSSCSMVSPFAQISWASDFNHGYTRGQAVDWYGSALPAVDFVFATYVGAPDSVPSSSGGSPADILQQVGMPSSGSCTDVSEPSLNWAGVGEAGWAPSWAQWRNQGGGGAICGRTLYLTHSGTWAIRI